MTIIRIYHPFRGYFQRQYGVLSVLILVVALCSLIHWWIFIPKAAGVYQQFVQTSMAQDQEESFIHSISGLLKKKLSK